MAEPRSAPHPDEPNRPAPEIVCIEGLNLGGLPIVPNVGTARISARSHLVLFTLGGIAFFLFGIIAPFVPALGMTKKWGGFVFAGMGLTFLYIGWAIWQSELRKLNRWLLLLDYFRTASAEQVQLAARNLSTLFSDHEKMLKRFLGHPDKPPTARPKGWSWPRVIATLVALVLFIAFVWALATSRKALALGFAVACLAIFLPLVVPSVILLLRFQRRYVGALVEKLRGRADKPSWLSSIVQEPGSITPRASEPTNGGVPRTRIIFAGGYHEASPDSQTTPDAMLIARPHWGILQEGTIPPPGDYRFEPVVITPTETRWSLLLLFGISGSVIIAYWIVAAMRLVPTSWYSLTNILFRHLSVQLMLGLGGPAFVWWIWRQMVRPQYVRLAPGMIQFMEYPWWGIGNPRIRSYPMTDGTLAVLNDASITLARGADRDSIDLSAARKKDELLSVAIFAMLSTAPTPPLNEVGLVG